jgi:3-hydroxyisobutyrate dehydrogenase-like beta-hydroxyacid dehydrogenase
MARDTVGVLGLGYMGSRIAAKLLGAGYDVTVWDRKQESRGRLLAQGAAESDSPRELARAVDVLLVSLTDDDVVRQVALGEGGAISGLRAGSVYLECSTVSPETIEELAAAVHERGATVVDASISGSTPSLEQSTAVVLVGGDDEAVARVQPLLEPWSRAALHMGGTGAGSAMKLAVNVILGVGMQAIAEAVVLGEAQGLERERVIDALGHTAVISDAHRGKLANARNDDYPVTFAARLMRKDFHLAIERARERGIELPATEAAARAADSDETREHGDEDFSVVVRGMEQAAGLAGP